MALYPDLHLLLLRLVHALFCAGVWPQTDESEGGSELATELGIYKLPTLMFCGMQQTFLQANTTLCYNHYFTAQLLMLQLSSHSFD
jgi:hypothetical protein